MIVYADGVSTIGELAPHEFVVTHIEYKQAPRELSPDRLQYMTVNEVRELLGLPVLPELFDGNLAALPGGASMYKGHVGCDCGRLGQAGAIFCDGCGARLAVSFPAAATGKTQRLDCRHFYATVTVDGVRLCRECGVEL
jgi:hypothetical protein